MIHSPVGDIHHNAYPSESGSLAVEMLLVAFQDTDAGRVIATVFHTLGAVGLLGGFVAYVTVPLDVIGLSPQPGQKLKADLGYIFGNKQGSEARVRAYWVNNGFSANVVDDIPNEARLTPAEWGEATVE